MSGIRALHFVFKVGNRSETAKFYRQILGMKFLRHEEFDEGCKAACNGPYDGKWSKSMVGYGAEDDHFVVELTYNYGIGSYKLGNDFMGITIHSTSVLSNAKKHEYPVSMEDGKHVLESPDGYKFYIVEEDISGDPVHKVTLACSDLAKSVDYWVRLCGMTLYSQADKSAVLGYSENQCNLELCQIDVPVHHATAFGRIAFSCPTKQLPGIQEAIKSAGHTILTPLVSLDTPGKATVHVVILADPDGHEICFVGEEAFHELSQVDPNADRLLDEAMKLDRSDEWFLEKGLSKGQA